MRMKEGGKETGWTQKKGTGEKGGQKRVTE